MMRKTLIRQYFWLTAVLCIAIVGSVWAGLGEVAFEKWNGIGGVLVTDLTNTAAFPDSPDETGFMPDFKTGWNLDDNYGARLWAYVMPPATGDYTFWIYADDYAELLLSPTINREDAQVIAQVNGWTSEAQWDKYAEQQSAPISLQGGRPYYMEAIWKEGGGGDGCGVGWGGPVIGAGPVIIAGQYCSTLVPNITINPTPADGATLVPIDTDLSWEGPTLIPNASFEIYIGTDPNTDFGTKYTVGEGVTTFDLPADLAYGTTYHWRVDSVDPNDGNPVTYKGIEWSFTTSPLYPVVTTQPQLQQVFPGETAQFSVGIHLDPAAPTDVTYQWKKEDPNTGDTTVLTDGGDISGATTDTLSIANVDVSDEALYYCVVSNSNGSDESGKANLYVKRMVLYWPLDGDTKDYSGNGFDAVRSVNDPAKPLPQFVPGVPQLGGQALEFNNVTGDDGQFANAGDVDVEQMTGQLTISLWVNWYGTNGQWQGIIGKRNNWAPDQMMWQLEMAQSGSGVNFARNGSSSTPAAPLDKNVWTHLVLTYDGEAVATLYKNGELVGFTDSFTYGTGVDTNLGLGTDNIDDTGVGANLFYGVVDDVRLYNYPWSPLEVARYYTGITGSEVCLGNPEMDLNGDCIVNLEDFAIFAVNWMECNRFPADACN